jgi:hypothetical protein
MRYLIENLVSYWIDGLYIRLDVYRWSSTSFGLTRSLFDVLRIRWRVGKLLHQIVQC